MAKPLSKVVALIKPFGIWLSLASLAAIAVSLIEAMIPLQVRSAVNATFSEGRGMGVHWGSVAALAALLAASQLLKIGQRLLTEWPATRVGAALFQCGTHHLLSYPMTWFTANHSGAVQVRLERSTRAVADFIKTFLSDILPPLIGVVISASLIWRANTTIGIVTIASTSLLVLLTVWQARNQAGIRIAINRAREEQGIRVAEAVLGIEQVKLFRAESAEAERAGQVSRILADKEYRHHQMMALFDLGKFLVDRAGFGIVLICGLLAASRPDSDLGPGGVLMLVMLYERIAEPVRHLHRIIDETAERAILAQDYLKILEAEPVTRAMKHGAESAGHDVVFNRVTFTYDNAEEPTLKEVSLQVTAGRKVAVVGPSGSGKSTLAKLLTGIYHPDGGLVLVNGREVKPIEQAESTNTVGMLSQEIYIFAGTVADNIRYGCPDSTDEQVHRAAEIAGLAEFIEALENGYDTPLGQHGSGLSGGQKQRLALARVILQDPDVLVFDEPSSSLDPENSRRFFQMALEVFKEKTVFVITHNLINLEWADQIVLLENGRVQETGSLQELCVNNTSFRRLRDGGQASASTVETV